jgi:hypothetical protein
MAADGTCGAIPALQDPDNDCGANHTCYGATNCKLALGEICTGNDDTLCASGACSDGVCCNEACDGLCEACTMVLSGAADGTCDPIDAGEDPDDECGMGKACDGAGMCEL